MVLPPLHATAAPRRGPALLFALSALLALADDESWPDYRGPGRDGRAPEARPPVRWSEDEHVAWKTPVHGRGWSSPVVLEGRVWLTTATEDGRRLSVVGLDAASGETLVDRVLFEVAEPQPRNALNSYASPSCALAPGRVYVHFGYAGTACLDAATGETLWERRDLVCEHREGPGSSLLVHGDKLVFNVDGADVQYVVALDRKSGETVWRTERTVDLSGFPPDLRKAYSTPIVASVDGREELISSGAQATVAYDPNSGEELWTVRHDGFSMSSRPLWSGELLYLNSGFMRPWLYAVRPGGEGDVTASHVVWSTANGVPTMSSPVLHDAMLFQVSDGGIATCLDAASGDALWKERLGGEFSASPVLAGDALYCFDREGGATVVRAAPEFEVLAENELAEGCMASPAVLGDSLIVRTTAHVYRLERGAAAAQGGG